MLCKLKIAIQLGEGKEFKYQNTYTRMTLLSGLQVTWNQVQGLTRVGSQLWRTLLESFSASFKAWSASPAHQTFMLLKSSIIIMPQVFTKFADLRHSVNVQNHQYMFIQIVKQFQSCLHCLKGSWSYACIPKMYETALVPRSAFEGSYQVVCCWPAPSFGEAAERSVKPNPCQGKQTQPANLFPAWAALDSIS